MRLEELLVDYMVFTTQLFYHLYANNNLTTPHDFTIFTNYIWRILNLQSIFNLLHKFLANRRINRRQPSCKNWKGTETVVRRCSSKPVFLKIWKYFSGKHLCRSLFLIKLQVWRPATLSKRDSNTDVFLWILRNF